MAHADVSTVGVIINPHAGKDIRRLVSAAGQTSDAVKIGIVRRGRGRRPRTGRTTDTAEFRHAPTRGTGSRGHRRADRVRREPADGLASGHDRRRAVDVEGTGRSDHRARRRRDLPGRRNGVARRAADRHLHRHQQRLPDGARRHDRRCRRGAGGDRQSRHHRGEPSGQAGGAARRRPLAATPSVTRPRSSKRP